MKRIAEEVESKRWLPDALKGMSKGEIAYIKRMWGQFKEFLINSTKGVNHGGKNTAERDL